MTDIRQLMSFPFLFFILIPIIVLRKCDQAEEVKLKRSQI